MHTALLCAQPPAATPSDAVHQAGGNVAAAASAASTSLLLLPPAVCACICSFVAPEDEPGGRPTELVHTAMAGVIGRALLNAPSLYEAAMAQAGTSLQLPDCHVHFAQR